MARKIIVSWKRKIIIPIKYWQNILILAISHWVKKSGKTFSFCLSRSIAESICTILHVLWWSWPSLPITWLRRCDSIYIHWAKTPENGVRSKTEFLVRPCGNIMTLPRYHIVLWKRQWGLKAWIMGLVGWGRSWRTIDRSWRLTTQLVTRTDALQAALKHSHRQPNTHWFFRMPMLSKTCMHTHKRMHSITNTQTRLKAHIRPKAHGQIYKLCWLEITIPLKCPFVKNA